MINASSRTTTGQGLGKEAIKSPPGQQNDRISIGIKKIDVARGSQYLLIAMCLAPPIPLNHAVKPCLPPVLVGSSVLHRYQPRGNEMSRPEAVVREKWNCRYIQLRCLRLT